VSLAGLAFGVIASAATTTAPGSAAPPRTGTAPGPSSVVVSRNVPLDMNTLRLSRPATAALMPTAPDGR
jgi:hypothetical protein